MSFLAVTIPVSLLLAGTLLWLVLRAARRGDFDDWEGPALRHLFDDDRLPERPDVDLQHDPGVSRHAEDLPDA